MPGEKNRHVKKVLAQKFELNLRKIAYDLIYLFGLKFTQDINELSNPLLRWLDFRLRYIDPIPRKIVFSDRFPKTIPEKFNKALCTLEEKIRLGEDINACQGKGLNLFHDISCKKRQLRTDLLLADWGIHHLHISDAILCDDGFAERSDWLLFFIFNDSSVAFIDTHPHQTNEKEDLFSNSDLIDIATKNWPKWANNFKLNGVLPDNLASNKRSTKDITKLRNAGIVSSLTIGGEVYLPFGLGVTTASTSTRVTLEINKIRFYLKELSDLISLSDSQFQKEAKASRIKNPSFTLELSPKGIIVYEISSKKEFLLPPKTVGMKSNFLIELNDLITPLWVRKRLKIGPSTS